MYISEKTKVVLGVFFFIAFVMSVVTVAVADTAAPKGDPNLYVLTKTKVSTPVVKEVKVEPVFNANKADRMVVRITNLKGEGRGTGFYVGNDTVVTAAHITVVKAWWELYGYVRIFHQKEELEHLLIWDKLGNVALGTTTIRDTKTDFGTIVLSNNKLSVDPVVFADVPPNRGDTLYMIGMPASFPWSLSKGYLMHTTYELKEQDITVGLASMAGTSGTSGSPLFNERGEIVGIASAMFDLGDALAFVPYSVFKDKLDAK